METLLVFVVSIVSLIASIINLITAILNRNKNKKGNCSDKQKPQ